MTIYINKNMIGEDMTQADALVVIQVLQDMNYEVEYGGDDDLPPDDIQSDDWDQALDIMLEANYAPARMVPLPDEVLLAIKEMHYRYWEKVGIDYTYRTAHIWLKSLEEQETL